MNTKKCHADCAINIIPSSDVGLRDIYINPWLLMASEWTVKEEDGCCIVKFKYV